MQKRYRVLTKNQQAAWEVIQDHPGEWLGATDIWRILNPGKTPQGMELASFGYSLHFMPPKVLGLYEKFENYERQYTYDPEAVGSSDAGDTSGDTDEEAILKDIYSSAKDQGILTEALLMYSASIVKKNPGRALRAAFLAKNAGGLNLLQKSKKTPKKVSVASEIEEPEEIPQPIIPMPEGMTYEDLVQAAEEAYMNEAFDYAEAAQRAGLSQDYFRHILSGDATPTRKNLDKVYNAIFGNPENPA